MATDRVAAMTLASAAREALKRSDMTDVQAFDPATANTAETSEQARALATAWADGRRSWINVTHADTQERRLEVVAVLDAQEVVKWSALAVALAQIDVAEVQRQVAIDGAPL